MSSNDQSSREQLTKVVSSREIRENIELKDVINAIDSAFVDYYTDDAIMPAKTYVDLDDNNGDFRAMPASIGESSGVKWVNVHPDNPSNHNLPTVMGIVVYSDSETGFPLAIMDGTLLTQYRTGAVAAVATRYLAPPKANSLGLLGAGQQAHTQLDAISQVIDLDRVIVSDLDTSAAEEFIEVESDRNCEFTIGDPRSVAECDVISTTTPSTEPILYSDWLNESTHINAMGADAVGKQELDHSVIQCSNIIVDDWEQCSHSGEINVAVSDYNFTKDDIYASLDEVVATEHSLPTNEVTVFDSTGLAIQDIATAELVYKTAIEEDIGVDIEIV